jgi:glycosyltransferase involved in cell wall biosynthesis
MPTVASDWGPYREVISEVTEGFLCSTKEDWVSAITTCLFKNDERLKMVKAARNRVREWYNIKGKAKTWRDVLAPNEK